MRPLIAGLLLAAAGCGSTPTDQPTVCPADKQFCMTSDDAGCTIVKVTCCDGNVPACAGTYSDGNPSGCAALPSQDHCG